MNDGRKDVVGDGGRSLLKPQDGYLLKNSWKKATQNNSSKM